MKRLFALILLLASFELNAQKVTNDTSYYERFPGRLQLRAYLAQKFLKFNIPSESADDIEYKANTKLNLGIGFTYHNISANIFYGFAALNKDTAKGKSKGLDLQVHLFPRRWAIDILALMPKGYHLEPKGFVDGNLNKYYYRPDIQIKLFGVSAYKVPNKAKFSYRAALQQSEWQKKSAGSLLYGGIAYYGLIEGDSALVPKRIQANYSQRGIDNVNYMALGAGIGYAYTLVMARHFFITASMVGNVDATFTSEEIGTNGAVHTTSVAPSLVGKAAIGYNSRTWAFSINSASSAFWTKGGASSQKYYLPTGQLRLSVSRRFDIRNEEHKAHPKQ